MFTIQIERWIPAFLRGDKNAYACAKAIEAALQYMNDPLAAGLALISDVESMPEWRLDELAWEYNLPYDYSADVEVKRRWVEDAYSLYRLWGTRAVIQQYLDGYFDSTTVQENWEYGGSPYHFRVNMEGAWTPESAAWAVNAIEKIKNLRSTVDGFSFETPEDVSMPELKKITIGPDGTEAEAESVSDLRVGIGEQLLISRSNATDELSPEDITWYTDADETAYADQDNDILIGG